MDKDEQETLNEGKSGTSKQKVPGFLEAYSETIDPKSALKEDFNEAVQQYRDFRDKLRIWVAIGVGIVGLTYGLIVGSVYYIMLGAILLLLFVYLSRLQ